MSSEDHHVTDHALLAALTTASDTRCPVCSRTLPAPADMHCPHCKSELRITFGSPDFRLAAWIGTLILLAIPLGFFTALTILMISAILLDPEMLVNEMPALAAFAGAALFFTALTVILARVRRQFWRTPALIQWMLMAVGGTVSIGALIVMIRIAFG